jgi:hypothetical protein
MGYIIVVIVIVVACASITSIVAILINILPYAVGIIPINITSVALLI